MKEYREYEKSVLNKVITYSGWGIAILSLLIAVYSEFIKKDEPQLEYDMVSSTKFINDKESSARLKIFVDSVDVQANHLNISAFNIRVENKGTSHIRYNDYERGRFGLRLSNGVLLEQPVLVDASTDYIRTLYQERSDSTTKSSNFVAIPDISLDVRDFYIIRVVILHNTDTNPLFYPEGKIVGQKNIRFNTLQVPAPNFWSLVFIGKWYVHIVRFFVYLLSIILVSIVVALSFSKIDDVISKRNRIKLIDKYSKEKKIEQFVCEDYIENGEMAIQMAYELYKKKEYVVTNEYKTSKSFVNSSRALESNNIEALRYHRRRYRRLCEMANKGYFEIKEDDVIVYNKHAQKSIKTLYPLLKPSKLSRINTPIYFGDTDLLQLKEEINDLQEQLKNE